MFKKITNLFKYSNMAIYPIPDIDNQIIKLLHIGELIQLSETSKLGNQKIINLDSYKSAKLFYNNKHDKFIGYSVFQKYFLAACGLGLFEIIRYLFEKYIFDVTILKKGYEEILKTNNLNIIQQFSCEFGSRPPETLDPFIKWYLSPNIIEYIFGPNNISCSRWEFEIASLFGNLELMTYIYSKSNFPMDFIYSKINLDKYSNPQIKWLINNCKIDSTINQYISIYPFIWPYYNSKNNGIIYSNPDDQFLIIFGQIIFENQNPILFDKLLPNKINQKIISDYIDISYWWQKYDLAIYLIKNFLVDQYIFTTYYICGYTHPEILNCLLDKFDNYPQALSLYELCDNKLLTEILITRKKIPKTILTESAFVMAANSNNHVLLKFILENNKLDLSKIKYNLNKTATAKTAEILIETGIFDFKYIKIRYLDNIDQEWVYGTDLLWLVISEIKKSKYKPEIDLQKLFNLTCTISKNQAKLVYKNYKEFIQLTKNQMVWLG